MKVKGDRSGADRDGRNGWRGKEENMKTDIEGERQTEDDLQAAAGCFMQFAINNRVLASPHLNTY